MGNEYRSQYSAFDLALRSIECPTTLILGSQMEFGRMALPSKLPAKRRRPASCNQTHEYMCSGSGPDTT